MGTWQSHSGVFSKDLLCAVLILAAGCSLFKKQEDEQVPSAAPAVATVAPPPVFNVSPAVADGSGGTRAVAEPARAPATVSRAGASAKGVAGAASKTTSAAAASASTNPATPSAAPSITLTPPPIPTVSKECVSACTSTFSTCVQGGQLQTCQQALKSCMDSCAKQ